MRCKYRLRRVGGAPEHRMYAIRRPFGDPVKDARGNVMLFENWRPAAVAVRRLNAQLMEGTQGLELGELFNQVGEDEFQCTICGWTNLEWPDLVEEHEFSSFGGTTEGYERCTVCGSVRSWADLSAVI
jgi:hypothetical protein